MIRNSHGTGSVSYRSRVLDLSLMAAWNRGLVTGLGLFAAVVGGLVTVWVLGALP